MDGTEDGTGPPLLERSEFSTSDTETAEQFLHAAYTTANRFTITGMAEDFEDHPTPQRRCNGDPV